jgi:hypothetical protein
MKRILRIFFHFSFSPHIHAFTHTALQKSGSQKQHTDTDTTKVAVNARTPHSLPSLLQPESKELLLFITNCMKRTLMQQYIVFKVKKGRD